LGNKAVTETEKSDVTKLMTKKSGLSGFPNDLQIVIESWDTLPEVIKKGILSMVKVIVE
jgi:hypothetical protein